MKKKIYQVITILFIIILIVGNVGNTSSNANSSSSFTLDKIMEDAKTFIDNGEGNDKFESGSIEEMIKSIHNVLLVMGIIAIVIVGIILSIQFITGSLEDQAKVKEMLVPYIVGSVVILTAFTIWKIVVDVLQTVQDA